MNFKLPPVTVSLPIFPVNPLPARDVKPLTSHGTIPLSFALSETATARGCSLLASREYASVSNSSSVPPTGRISVTTGCPLVIVPVLSRTTTPVCPAISRDDAVLNRIPFFAPTPLPTIIATGVARPRAQGQEITSTDMPRASA